MKANKSKESNPDYLKRLSVSMVKDNADKLQVKKIVVVKNAIHKNKADIMLNVKHHGKAFYVYFNLDGSAEILRCW